jgi:hypothetical protein
MAKKFIRTLKDEAKDIARNINDSTVLAYDVKRKEIEEKYIPPSVLGVLYPDEIRRAERAGLVIGFLILVAIAVGVWWVLL